MAYRLPRQSIWGALVPPAAYFASSWSLLKEDISATEWWHQIPFGWLGLTMLAYALGLAVNELCYPLSNMRHNWRELRKVFEVLSVNTAHRTDQDAERVAIVCQLKFLKELNDARLTVRVVTGLPGRPSARQIVYQEQISGPKDSTKSLVLGSLPITRPGAPFARHDVWSPQLPGPDIAPGQVTMIPGARSIIELSVGPQSYRLYVQALNPTREDSTRLYLLCEDEFPWPVG
jgi:hypothetical protein